MWNERPQHGQRTRQTDQVREDIQHKAKKVWAQIKKEYLWENREDWRGFIIRQSILVVMSTSHIVCDQWVWPEDKVLLDYLCFSVTHASFHLDWPR
jgi:hypothetical protein